MTRRTPLYFAAIVTTALALVGCGTSAPSGDEATSVPSDAPSTATAKPTPDPTAEATETPVDPPTAANISCDSMLDPLVDDALRATQLQPFEKQWTQFNFTPSGAAIECPWGYEGQSHSVVYFAWAALAEGEGEQFLALAAENGYTTTEDEQGTWLVAPATEPPGASAILITESWIAYAPTPELIPAIVWAR